MPLQDDLRIIRDHFIRALALLLCETVLSLFFRWNPAHFSKEETVVMVALDSWFVVATLGLFAVTCLLLLLRSSWRDIFAVGQAKGQE